MTKFVDYICESVAQIAENKFESNENSVQDNFHNTLNDTSKFMEKMGISNKIIDDVSSALSNKFYELIQNGASPEQAFKEAFESASNILNSSISNNSSIKEFGGESNEYDLGFASSLSFEKSVLIDEAISKGMSVKEAINFVNNKTNDSNNDFYGPPNYQHNDKIIAKTEDEKNLDKIEADMDEQANKIDRDDIDNDTSLNKAVESSDNHSESDEMS